ncbi:two-component system capsular synthesis response regulator RcsB [Erwinia toletana]|uniref:Two-component system capsular synthesis response regulator RcsB n=1 Tax=Winslowiella toletana TaxID=92490 RepID=A0ABS4PAR0_9GAMM|nr:response regulator [Winslowiella toletana]MBP2169719.1 two-component system capsular synthesis response regulator RcsB [Winslowiella toletana]
MSIRVIVADDHPVFLLGLRGVLASLPEDYQIVAEAHDVSALFAQLALHPVEMLITDLNMPGDQQVDGVRMIGRVRQLYPNLTIVVITMLSDPRILELLTRYRVKAVLNKSSLSQELADGLRSQQPEDQPWLSDVFRSDPLQQIEKALSAKELEVLRLIGQGLSVNDIAARLYRTKQTISAQKLSAMRKLGLENDAALWRYLNQTGLGQ